MCANDPPELMSPAFSLSARLLHVQGFDDPDLLEAFPGLAVAVADSESQIKRGPAAPTQGEAAGEGGGQEGEEEEGLKAASQAEAECALLERAAHYALMMNADLQAWKPFPDFCLPTCVGIVSRAGASLFFVD